MPSAKRLHGAQLGLRSEVTDWEAVMSALVGNIILGVWLVLSAVLWLHTTAQMVNLVGAGSLLAVLSMLATGTAPAARFGATAVALWLVWSSLWFPVLSRATQWHQLSIGCLALTLSLLAGPGERGQSGARQPPRFGRAP
jgi:hypothetical protein